MISKGLFCKTGLVEYGKNLMSGIKELSVDIEIGKIVGFAVIVVSVKIPFFVPIVGIYTSAWL